MLPRRLDKFLADARIGSRGHIEALAARGAIRLNGVPAHNLRRLGDPVHDVIEADGRLARITPPSVYALLHKPRGVVTTLAEPRGKRCVAELLPAPWLGRVGVVGRLDKPTTGALLITDDGDLSHLLTDPGFHVWKGYVLTVVGHPAEDDPRLTRLREGVALGGATSRPARCGVVPDSARPGRGDTTLTDLWIELREGRYRQVRRMASGVGFKLTALHRTAIGPLQLGDLEVGRWRSLEQAEIEALYGAAGGRGAPEAGARRALIRRMARGELDADEVALVQRYLAARGRPRLD